MADVWVGARLNRPHRVFDKLLELRDGTAAAITATTSGTGIAFDCRKLLDYVCVVTISAMDAADANESYIFSVEVSDLIGGTYTAIATSGNARLSGVGTLIIGLSGEAAQRIDADSKFIRITATLAGTTPSLTYGAYLAPSTF